MSTETVMKLGIVAMAVVFCITLLAGWQTRHDRLMAKCMDELWYLDDNDDWCQRNLERWKQ